jgi:hypothetical protein
LEVNNLNFQEFKTLIETLEKTREKYSALYDLGIDTLTYDEDYQKVITILMESVFREEGKDWIDWYLYERVGFDGKMLEAWDENENPICHNVESLWETIKPYRKQ